LELVITSLAITTETIPATMNLDNQDPDCDLDYVPKTPRSKRINIALSNSFGFGGHNAALVFVKP
jgi:3-oxoacyl-[acyl-carrier-protein] synthase II